uniref:Family with sequence similarity 117 member A n=1 Tax=Scophthalmus maximus TaxID=52904 RepID=A0A8D3DWW1_SCOMX
MSARGGAAPRGCSPSLQPLRATVPYQLQRGSSALLGREVKTADRSAFRPPKPTIRRALSLDAIVGPYLQGQWPKEVEGAAVTCVNDKATQTPSSWAEETQGRRGVGGHKRSASWGSAEHLREASVCSLIRSGPPEEKTRLLSRPGGAAAALRASPPRGPWILPSSPPVRPPVPSIHPSCRLRIPLRPRTRSFCPRHGLPVPWESQVRRLCNLHIVFSFFISHFVFVSISGLLPTTCTEPVDCEPRCPSPSALLPSFALEPPLLQPCSSSPRPNKTYSFQREPPEGCDIAFWTRKTCIEYGEEPLLHPSCPDPNKVNFTPHGGSAFCPVSLLKPLLPSMDLLFRGLSVSPVTGCPGQASPTRHLQ